MLASPTMGKKTKRNDVIVKIDAEAARLAKIVAAYEDKTQAAVLSEIVIPVLKKRLAKHQGGKNEAE